MSGMDANLTIAQAKAQQERTSASSAGTGAHQGPMKKGKGMSHEICEKVPHQGK